MNNEAHECHTCRTRSHPPERIRRTRETLGNWLLPFLGLKCAEAECLITFTLDERDKSSVTRAPSLTSRGLTKGSVDD
jgi:hypothetical protein